ncbi:MAG: magnesium transporter [Burkholderiaceae bacterium]
MDESTKSSENAEADRGTVDESAPWEHIGELLDRDLMDRVAEGFDALPPGDDARAFMHLDNEQRTKLLTDGPIDLAVELLDKLPTEFAAGEVDKLKTERAGQIFEQLDSDVAADLISEMGEAEAILAEMPAEAASDVRRLAAYEPWSAGGLMITESLTFSQDQTIANVLARLAEGDPDDDRYRGQNPYALDDNGRVVGYTPLGALLSSRRIAPLRQIMLPAMSVAPATDLDKLLDIFDEYDFLSIPVCDEEGHLLGVVLRHAADAAAIERSELDSYKRHGVVSDELRSMPLLLRSRRRLTWLSANIGLNIVAASVISMYEATLAAVIALAVFLPMVSDMSGCSGNQAVAVSLREQALGLLKPVDVFYVWTKEASVGVINGIVLGVIIGVVAWVWKGNPVLGLVIGGALAINTVLAVSLGGIIPLVLKRFNQDPAVASGPLLTTMTDMAGFFLVLSMATVLMPWLK